MHLPVWQALRSELAPKGVEIVTVAMDTAGAEVARPFVEAAAPEHPSLIDEEHVIGRLFGVINVPNSVWIDEDGNIVRPVEPAHPDDGRPKGSARYNAPDDAPQELKDILAEANKIVVDPVGYTARLRDWAEKGAASQYVLSPEQVLAHAGPRGRAESEAAARFELGQYLWRNDDQRGAVPHWREAHRSFPDNWTYKRQAWIIAHPMQGHTDDYDSSWIEDIRKIGAENYYPPLPV